MPSSWSFSQEFNARFQAEGTDLLAKLEVAKTSGTPLSSNDLQSLSAELVRLRKMLAEATGYLPSFDQRQAEMQTQQLENVLEELRSASVLKPKFTFKKKERSFVISASGQPVPNALPSQSVSTAPGIAELTKPKLGNLTISGQHQQYLSLNSLPAFDCSPQCSDITISELDNCIVDLASLLDHDSLSVPEKPSKVLKISAIRVQNVVNTLMLLPRIEGSILLQDLNRCTIVVGCHQFRMHNSRNVNVYLSILSHPIIENCSGIRFARYPEALSARNEDNATNKYADVHDFSHIKPTPSPNWSVISSDALIVDWPVTGPLEVQQIDAVLSRCLPG